MRIQSVVDVHGLSPRIHGQVMKQINGEVGERHARLRIQKHFKRNSWTSPGGAYGYLKRTGRTLAMKRRKGSDPFRPNFYTGRMMAEILASSIVRKTQFQWTYQARNVSHPLKSERRRELEAVSKDEIAADTSYMEKRYTQQVQQLQRKRLRRSKYG